MSLNIAHMDTVKITTRHNNVQVGCYCGSTMSVERSIQAVFLVRGFSWSSYKNKKFNNKFYRKIDSISKINHTRMVLIEKIIDVKKSLRPTEEMSNWTIYNNNEEIQLGESRIAKHYWEY
jgi:hypoxanthine-guanine phosphoribosyltransferase